MRIPLGIIAIPGSDGQVGEGNGVGEGHPTMAMPGSMWIEEVGRRSCY